MNVSPVVTTGDGSHTIMDVSLQVTYHSMHGALGESQHVFIHHGLKYISEFRKDLSILEVGFGTGLNALLTYLYGREHPALSLSYIGIEKYPLPPQTISQLNYCVQLRAGHATDIFHQFHDLRHMSIPQFRFQLYYDDIFSFKIPESIDLVYFDAFAPGAQPEMWSPAIFEKLKASMNPGGILVTFCAQGQFKRTLRSLGYLVEALPGPPGKREMVRAIVG